MKKIEKGNRTNYFYCDICDDITRHIRLTDYEWSDEYTVDRKSGFDKFINYANQYNPLWHGLTFLMKVTGDPLVHWKCTGCSGYTSYPQSNEEHSFYMDEKWWSKKDLVQNRSILEKVRKKYNPNLLKKKK